MSASKLKVAFFGECMIELSGQPLKQGFGGDTLNSALYLARLCQDSQIAVYYATGLGYDDLSQQLLLAWQAEGIDTSLVTRHAGRLPGLYLVSNDASGERRFHYWRDSAAAKFYFSDAQLSPLERALQAGELDWLYLSGISLAILPDADKARLIDKLRAFSLAGGKVAFDNNFRPQLWSAQQARHWYGELLPWVDLAFITQEDDEQIWGQERPLDERYQQWNCAEVVVKRGAQPCQLFLRQQGEVQSLSVAAEKVAHVVDTCAAGDAFAAGYLAGRLSGSGPQASAELAHRLAALIIQHSGAIIPAQSMRHLQLESGEV
ncbi:sugar kinase [Vibrio navarrensis]|nr:sugar kinase [Vibrio navarrensis]